MSSFREAMKMLGDAGAVFIGQGVVYDGVAIHRDFEDVEAEQKIEFPVAEELQLGTSIGMAMEGVLVVSVFPRVDFLMRAMDQIVNHLDKIEQMSCGQWRPKVIIRAKVGTKTPLDAGPQHTQNHAKSFREMLTNVEVAEIQDVSDIMPAYQAAMESEYSTIIIETC